MEWPPRIVALVEWSQPRPGRQAVCSVEGVQKTTKALEGAQKIMSELQILDIELFTLL